MPVPPQHGEGGNGMASTPTNWMRAMASPGLTRCGGVDIMLRNNKIFISKKKAAGNP